VTGTVPGIEWSGEVVECGAEVKGVKPGDRVMCVGQAGYAEYAVADWGRTTPIPANNVSWEQAATYPVALGTMHDAIVTNAKLQRGEAIMIQGASSGVGLLGLQIAKLRGAKLVIGTSTNDARRARLKEFGADLVIDPRKANWSEDVLKATDGKGAEVVIDMISGPTVNENMKAAAVLGRIVNVGRLGGGHIEFDCNLHANKRIAYIGVTHRTRSIDYAIVMDGEIDMLLDDTEVHCKAGDVLVQQGTNHAWVNKSGKPCRICFVLIDSENPPAWKKDWKPKK